MFEGLRKNSQSFMLVVLIASLATMFGVSFGPRGGGGGCSREVFTGPADIARVEGTTITEQDFQTMARLTGLNERGNARLMRQAIVDGLIERELLAHQAEQLGYSVSDDALNAEIRDGYYYVSLGSRDMDQIAGPFGARSVSARQQTSYAREGERNANEPRPPFVYDEFETWVHNAFSRTVQDYKRSMVREMLAEFMRNMVMVNVRVSEDEVWRDYERQHNQVALRYVDFSPDFYRLIVRDDDQAALDAFAHEHTAEIDQQWTARRESLHNLPEQVRIRELLVRFPDAAEEPTRIATQQRADAIRAQIASGGDFIRLARLYSEDETSWRAGGESAWVSRDQLSVPDDVKVAIHDLQPGQVSDPIRSEHGFYIIQMVGARHGDVAEADAKREIARDLYRIVRGNELAMAASVHAQSLLAAPGATLDSVAAAVHTEALVAFYHGEIPTAQTLPGNNNLEAQTHTDVGAPDLRETQPFTQGATIPGIEDSAPIVRAAFQLTDQAPSPAAPITVGDARYIIRLKDNGRQVASRDEFNHDRQELMEDFEVAKRREALQQYLSRLRTEAEREGRVRIGSSPLLQQGNPTDRRAPDPEG